MILAIDPGIRGAIAIIGTRGGLCRVKDLPIMKEGKKNIIDMKALHGWLWEFLPSATDTIVMEKVHAMPGQGVTSMFSFGRTVGQIEGLLNGLPHPSDIVYVTPQAWKKYHGLIKQPKRAAVELVREKYPDLTWPISKDGRADAVLMAEFGRYLLTEKEKGPIIT